MSSLAAARSGISNTTAGLPVMLNQAMESKSNSEKSSEPEAFSFVPATGTGVGKVGFRAWVSLAKPQVSPKRGGLALNNSAPGDSRGAIYTAPLLDTCGDGDRRKGFVVDRDFYLDWMDDGCKSSPTAGSVAALPTVEANVASKAHAASNSYGEGFTNSVAAPAPTGISSGISSGTSGKIEPGQPGTSPPLPSNYKLVWNDEFDGKSLDLNKWEHEINCHGGGNNEEQCYVAHDDVIKVENGLLTMRAIPAPEGYALMPTDKCNADPDSISKGACTNRKAVRSARIHTKGAKWRYGRFEMKAKIPIGSFLWPAFWMLPSSYKYGTWAASGEFDIMESRGQKPDEIGHALHYGAPWPNNVYSNQQYIQSDLADHFMVYGMDWDQKAIRFFVNNRYTYQVDAHRNWTSPTLNAANASPYQSPGQPWDQDFILLLNLAVGGNFFPGAKYSPDSDPKSWRQPFIIDYVRVYQPSN